MDKETNQACFACNTTDTVFGPIMSANDGLDIETLVDDFREDLGKDPREFDNADLCNRWNEFYLREIGEDE